MWATRPRRKPPPTRDRRRILCALRIEVQKAKYCLKIRHDAVFVSSVLFTIVLLSLVPSQWMNALPAGPRTVPLEAGWQMSAGLSHELSLANLATISTALIVLWTGYIKRLRSSWFIMFIVVATWFFPQTGIWRFNYSNTSEWLLDALKGPGLSREVAKLLISCALMLVALFLPIKAFFWRKIPITDQSKTENDHSG